MVGAWLIGLRFHAAVTANKNGPLQGAGGRKMRENFAQTMARILYRSRPLVAYRNPLTGHTLDPPQGLLDQTAHKSC